MGVQWIISGRAEGVPRYMVGYVGQVVMRDRKVARRLTLIIARHDYSQKSLASNSGGNNSERLFLTALGAVLGTESHSSYNRLSSSQRCLVIDCTEHTPNTSPHANTPKVMPQPSAPCLLAGTAGAAVCLVSAALEWRQLRPRRRRYVCVTGISTSVYRLRHCGLVSAYL